MNGTGSNIIHFKSCLSCEVGGVCAANKITVLIRLIKSNYRNLDRKGKSFSSGPGLLFFNCCPFHPL